MQKRSVRIANHRTSLSLEPEFWEEIKLCAAEEGVSINQLVTKIDADRTGNLSSALRVYVLRNLKEKKKAPEISSDA